jgi:hypothetical protein
MLLVSTGKLGDHLPWPLRRVFKEEHGHFNVRENDATGLHNFL